MAESNKGQESAMTWVLIGVIACVALGSLLWIVASHKIVYYFTPVLDAIAFPWRLMPDFISATAVNDLDLTYKLYRQYPNRIDLVDWIAYANQAFKPWLALFCVLYLYAFTRQLKRTRLLRREKMTPDNYVQQMVKAFPEIAPVVSIQRDIVADKYKEWRRQTFPDELLRKAQTPNKRPVLIIDPNQKAKTSVFAKKTDAERGLMIDRKRLAQHLSHTRVIKTSSGTRTFNKYLGFQITDLGKDYGRSKKGSGTQAELSTDRLSDVGKAMLALLAPQAFGGNAGRHERKKISDALNNSAYGTQKGFANLSLPIVQQSFEKWRSDSKVLNLAKIHHWEHTFLAALLAKARASGKLTTGSFIWLRPMSRILFWVLDDAGRKTPSAEGALAFSQYQFELSCIKKGILPLHRDEKGNLVTTILTDQVVNAFEHEWKHWREGIDDSDEWMSDPDLWKNLSDNPVWKSAWQDIEQSASVPKGAIQ